MAVTLCWDFRFVVLVWTKTWFAMAVALCWVFRHAVLVRTKVWFTLAEALWYKFRHAVLGVSDWLLVLSEGRICGAWALYWFESGNLPNQTWALISKKKDFYWFGCFLCSLIRLQALGRGLVGKRCNSQKIFVY